MMQLEVYHTIVNDARSEFNDRGSKFLGYAFPIETVEEGKMTKDLAVCIHGNKVNHGEHYLYTEEFLDAIDSNLKKKLAK